MKRRLRIDQDVIAGIAAGLIGVDLGQNRY